MYSNMKGGDGDRLYFDGCSSILINGKILAQAGQFTLDDVEVITANIDLTAIRTYRAAISSRNFQSASVSAKQIPIVSVDFDMGSPRQAGVLASVAVAPRYHSFEEEIAFGPACWLWDYLRRSSK